MQSWDIALAVATATGAWFASGDVPTLSIGSPATAESLAVVFLREGTGKVCVFRRHGGNLRTLSRLSRLGTPPPEPPGSERFRGPESCAGELPARGRGLVSGANGSCWELEVLHRLIFRLKLALFRKILSQ